MSKKKKTFCVFLAVIVTVSVGVGLAVRFCGNEGGGSVAVPQQLNNDVEPPADKNGSASCITFLSVDGSVLGVQTVSPDEPLVPPAAPQLPAGYVFSHWSSDLSDVEGDMVVTAVANEIPADRNVIALAGGYCRKGESVELPLTLCGQVSICAIDMVITYNPDELEYIEALYTDDEALINCNPDKGEIYLNLLSANNIRGDVDLCKLVFKGIAATAGQSTVDITVKQTVQINEDESFSHPECYVIPAKVMITGE